MYSYFLVAPTLICLPHKLLGMFKSQTKSSQNIYNFVKLRFAKFLAQLHWNFLAKLLRGKFVQHFHCKSGNNSSKNYKNSNNNMPTSGAANGTYVILAKPQHTETKRCRVTACMLCLSPQPLEPPDKNHHRTELPMQLELVRRKSVSCQPLRMRVRWWKEMKTVSQRTQLAADAAAGADACVLCPHPQFDSCCAPSVFCSSHCSARSWSLHQLVAFSFEVKTCRTFESVFADLLCQLLARNLKRQATTTTRNSYKQF